MRDHIKLTTKLLPIELIRVNRAMRQRQLLDEEVDALAENIRRRGLLNPIVVEATGEDYLLLAGERRLEAFKRLGRKDIPARLVKDLDYKERTMIEWAENAHRKDLPWQNKAKAICRFHLEMESAQPGWTYKQTAEEVGLSESRVAVACIVWKAAQFNTTLLDCTSLDQAYHAVERKFSRSLGAVLADTFELPDPVPAVTVPDQISRVVRETTDPNNVGSTEDMTAIKVSPEPARVFSPAEKKTHWEIAQGNFADWAEGYRGPPFNVIHCDFPYGIDFTNTGIFRKANTLDKFYDDNEQDFWQLCTVLRTNWEKLVAHDAHIIFWYSMNYYTEIRDYFHASVRDELGIKLYVDPFPLLWFKSDNKGMMHDAKRKPRRVYETAFLISVGDQHLCRPGSNVAVGPTAADKHPSAKPLSIVKQFLRMVTDENTRILDPTCGHGSAISAAIELEARAAYGVELDPTHVARARLEVAQTERRFREEREVVF